MLFSDHCYRISDKRSKEELVRQAGYPYKRYDVLTGAINLVQFGTCAYRGFEAIENTCYLTIFSMSCDEKERTKSHFVY